MFLISLLFDTACRGLEKRDKEGEDSGNSKGVECVALTIATATNALNSLK